MIYGRLIKEVQLNPKWFKVQLRSVQVIDGRQETHYSFMSGVDLPTTRALVKESMGLGWIIKLREIDYNEVIDELEKR